MLQMHSRHPSPCNTQHFKTGKLNYKSNLYHKHMGSNIFSINFTDGFGVTLLWNTVNQRFSVP